MLGRGSGGLGWRLGLRRFAPERPRAAAHELVDPFAAALHGVANRRERPIGSLGLRHAPGRRVVHQPLGQRGHRPSSHGRWRQAESRLWAENGLVWSKVEQRRRVAGWGAGKPGKSCSCPWARSLEGDGQREQSRRWIRYRRARKFGCQRTACTFPADRSRGGNRWSPPSQHDCRPIAVLYARSPRTVLNCGRHDSHRLRPDLPSRTFRQGGFMGVGGRTASAARYGPEGPRRGHLDILLRSWVGRTLK